MADERRRAHAELVHVRLADDDGAGALQLRDSGSVFGGHAGFECLERSRGPDAGRVVEVFDADRDAVQGSPPAARGDLSFGLAGRGERLIAEHGDKGVQFGVRCDLLETLADDADRRE